MPPAKRQDTGHAPAIVPEQNPPNPILFIQNLPEDATDKLLEPLFSRYPGFKSIRLVPSKGIGFVEYDSAINSSMALWGLQGFKFSPEKSLVVSFAK